MVAKRRRQDLAGSDRDPSMVEADECRRVDRWLHVTRLMKTRALAAALARSGRLRLDGVHVRKPGHRLRRGQVLTFVKAGRVWTVRVLDFAPRRLPAHKAVRLYEDLSPPKAADATPTAEAFDGSGSVRAPAPAHRPDKRQRRALCRWKRQEAAQGRADIRADRERGERE